jgi:hypothetical protein
LSLFVVVDDCCLFCCALFIIITFPFFASQTRLSNDDVEKANNFRDIKKNNLSRLRVILSELRKEEPDVGLISRLRDRLHINYCRQSKYR